MFISATPFSGPEGKGFGFVFFRISDRYALEITIRIPALTDPIHESDRYSYEDDGELLIRDDEAVPKSMRGELAMIKEALGIDAKTAQLACFGVESPVPATPDNLAQAILWCRANPRFMQDEQGI